MTPEKAKIHLAWVPYIQAVADGKTVQIKAPRGWAGIHGNDFDIDRMIERGESPGDSYRIKPEPREFWVDPENRVMLDSPLPTDHPDFDCFIHVREVLPES